MLLVLNLGVVSGLSRENILKPWKPDPRLFEASAHSLGLPDYLWDGRPPEGLCQGLWASPDTREPTSGNKTRWWTVQEYNLVILYCQNQRSHKTIANWRKTSNSSLTSKSENNVWLTRCTTTASWSIKKKKKKRPQEDHFSSALHRNKCQTSEHNIAPSLAPSSDMS